MISHRKGHNHLSHGWMLLKRRSLTERDLDSIQQGRPHPKIANAKYLFHYKHKLLTQPMNFRAYPIGLDVPFCRLDEMKARSPQKKERKKKEFISKTDPVQRYDTFDMAAFFLFYFLVSLIYRLLHKPLDGLSPFSNFYFLRKRFGEQLN